MKKKTDPQKRIAKLERIAADKGRPKKERKAARAEADALKGVFVPTPAAGITEGAPSSPSIDAAAHTSSPDASAPDDVPFWRERQDAEVARQWAHHTAQLVGLEYDRQKAAEAEYATGLLTLEAPTPAERIFVTDGGEARFPPEDETRIQKADRLMQEAVAEAGYNVALAQEATVVETDHGREIVVGPVEHVDGMPSGVDHPENDPLAKPADPVLENGLGQPMIHYVDPATGKEKVKGYTRVTTYIKGLEDTSVLEAWKVRTLLEGGAVELLQNDGISPSLEATARAVGRLDAALADIDRREKIEGELLGLRRAELLKEHRDLLAKIAEDLLELGGAHEKANKGTDLHRLTEIVDNGQPLPAGTSASDRRDVEAYQEAMGRLGITTVWTERRVVLDDIQVSGTMDRAYMVKLPGMARRIKVVGDLKTGSVSWGQGKIGMQLALYARGLGYDWTKPLERERLGLNQHHGLLVHLPQGEGVCSVYVVDLELAQRGLTLAREVREWRNSGKRVYDLKKPLEA